jgi:hypothetical protein
MVIVCCNSLSYPDATVKIQNQCQYKNLLLISLLFLCLLNTLTNTTFSSYMLPVTISDETRSLDAIAFLMVAEDLVEQNTYLTSQNMKIDSLDHITALDKAIEKTRLFHIGTSSSASSNFAIKYVLKKLQYRSIESSTSLQILEVLHFVCNLTHFTTILAIPYFKIYITLYMSIYRKHLPC